jgi:hypothetical protein
MKKSIFLNILLLFLIMVPAKAQKLEPILKLDDSKSYELYFVAITHPKEHALLKLTIPDTAYYDLYQYRRTELVFERLIDPFICYRSKKTGMAITVDTMRSFLVDDKETIKYLKDNWKGKKIKELPSCGYDYDVFIKENTAFIDFLWLNNSCSYLGSSWGNFVSIERPLDYIKKSIKIYTAKIECTTFKQKREILKDIKSDDKIFIHTGEYIPEFPGYFELEFENERPNKICKRIEKEIIQSYPNEKFGISFYPDINSSQPKTTVLRIECNKTLANKFNLYETRLDWLPNAIDILEIFFKDQSQIQWLIEKYTKD